MKTATKLDLSPAPAPLDWLMATAGPIIRYRVATELLAPNAAIDIQSCRHDLLNYPEVQKWLNRLTGHRIHGSTDQHLENVLAKLVEYGLSAAIAEFDQKARPYCDVHETGRYHNSAPHLVPFLIRAGYVQHEAIAAWLLQRLQALYRTARRGDYDFYLSKAEAAQVPKAWRGKPTYKPQHDAGGPYPLPTCYDLYAIAHFPQDNPEISRMMEAVVKYLSDPRFQSLPGGYHWSREKNRCWAAGREVRACCTPERRLLFVELAARFAAARQSKWFQQVLAELETFRTPRGTYRFASDLLKERPNSYYLYAGSHMGLGENRRSPIGLELESTFRMLRIKTRMGLFRPSKRRAVT